MNKVSQETNTFIYLEPLNRYEDYMINQVAEAANYIEELKVDRVKITADFFHMNIEAAGVPRTGCL